MSQARFRSVWAAKAARCPNAQVRRQSRSEPRSQCRSVRTVTALSICLFIFAYLSAVVDGSRQPTGLYPAANTGRKGLRRYTREHPWIIAGALAGIAGAIVAFL